MDFRFWNRPFLVPFLSLLCRSLWGSWGVGIDSIVFMSSRALKCKSNCPLKVPRKHFTSNRIFHDSQNQDRIFHDSQNQDRIFHDFQNQDREKYDFVFPFEKSHAHENPSEPSWSVFHELSNARNRLLWNPLLRKLEPAKNWTENPLWKMPFDDQNFAQNHKKWDFKYGVYESI